MYTLNFFLFNQTGLANQFQLEVDWEQIVSNMGCAESSPDFCKFWKVGDFEYTVVFFNGIS